MATTKYSINEVKKELQHISPKNLLEYCLKLAKHKVENKELLAYLLFDANNEIIFVENTKQSILDDFENANFFNTFSVKKTLRKILKFTNKNIKFNGNKKVEVELLLYFCEMMIAYKFINKSTVVDNIFLAQFKRIVKANSKLHEDEQFDFKSKIEDLQSVTSCS